MDRHADVAEVLRVSDGAHIRTIALNGAFTDNAAPDLADASPTGTLAFVALRGPTPLSGDPHNATGSTPGLGILQVTEAGRMLGRIWSEADLLVAECLRQGVWEGLEPDLSRTRP